MRNGINQSLGPDLESLNCAKLQIRTRGSDVVNKFCSRSLNFASVSSTRFAHSPTGCMAPHSVLLWYYVCMRTYSSFSP